jgi:hypothetical protein
LSRFSPLQNTFTSGLLSRRLRARDDLKQYHNGMRQALNGIVLPHGGFMRRPGTYFVNAVKNTTADNALIPFGVAVDQQYVMEVGYQYIRFYANHGRVIDPDTSDPLEVTTTYTVPKDIRWAQQADTMYLVAPNLPPRKLQRTGLTTFTLADVAWADDHAPMQPSNVTATTLTITGSGPYTLTWNADPKAGGLTSDDDVGRYVRFADYTYKITSVTSATVAVADRKHVGADPSPAATDWALGLFSDTDGCRAVCFFDGRLWYGGSRTAPDVVVASKSDDFDNFDRGISYGSTPTLGNDEMAFPLRLYGGELQTVQWLAGINDFLVAGSAGGEFRIFSAGSTDVLTPTTTAVRNASYRGSAYAVPQQIGTQIVFLQRNRRQCYQLQYDIVRDNFVSTDLMLMAEDVPDSDKNGRGGLLRTAYQATPDSILWLTHGDGSLIGLTYEPSQDVQGVVPQMIGNGQAAVDDICVIQNPDASADELWFLATINVGGTDEQYVCYMDKQFRPSLSYEQATTAEKVKAMDEAYFVDLGLSLDNPVLITAFTKTDPIVITAAAHGFSNGDSVKIRTPAGPTQLNLLSGIVANKTTDTFELTGVDATDFDDLATVPVPSTSNPNAPLVRKEVTTISGLDHLEGFLIQILADGAVHPDRTVSGGSITLQHKASIVRAGLGFNYKGQTQRFVGGGKLGTDQGQPATIDKVALVLQNTMGGAVGQGDGLELPVDPLNFRDGDSPMNQSPPLFTGTIEVGVDGSWSVEPTIYFENMQPLPMTVLAIAPRAQANEG